MPLKLCFFLLLLPFLAMTDETSLDYKLAYEVGGESKDFFCVNDQNATLIIKVYNPNPKEPIKIKRLSFNIPIGQGDEDLSKGDITPPEMNRWGLSHNGKGRFTAIPDAEYFDIGKEIIKFPFTDIIINSVQGTAPIEIGEKLKDGTTHSTTLECPKFPEGFFFNGPYADPVSVNLGGFTTITWEGSPDTSYTLEYSGVEPFLIDNEKYPPYCAENLQWPYTLFTLTAFHSNHGKQPIKKSKQILVEVCGGGPHLTSNHQAYLPGQKIRLNWNTVGAQEGSAKIINSDTGDVVHMIKKEELEYGSITVRAPLNRSSVHYELDYDDSRSGIPQGPIYTRTIALRMPKFLQNINLGKKPNCIAMSEDGQKAYVGNMDQTLSVIQIDTQKVLDTMKINMVPDVIKIVPGAKDRILIFDIVRQLIKLFDPIHKRQSLWAYTKHHDVKCIDVKNDKVYLAGDEFFIVKDLNNLNHHLGFVKMFPAKIGRPKPYPSPTSLDLSPKGEYAVITHAPNSSKVNYPGISVIDIRNGKKMTEKIIPVAFQGTSPSLSRCIRFFSDSDAAWSTDAGRIFHFRPLQGKLVGSTSISGGNTQAFLFSPDNSLVFYFNSAGEKSEMSIIDRKSTIMCPQKLSIPEFPGGPNPSRSMAFDANGKYLYICDPKNKGVAVYEMPAPLDK